MTQAIDLNQRMKMQEQMVVKQCQARLSMASSIVVTHFNKVIDDTIALDQLLLLAVEASNKFDRIAQELFKEEIERKKNESTGKSELAT